METAEIRLDPAVLTLRQRAGDLHERARLGGVFYLFSWLLVTGFGAGWNSYPVASALLALSFATLMLLRVQVRRRFLADPAWAAPSMRWQWTILVATAGLWSACACWALLDPVFAAARMIALIASVSLAMAFAQIFAVNPRLSLLGTCTVYLPMATVVALVERDIGLAMVLLLTGVYLVAVIGRSHREYEGRLLLDEELRVQRDRFFSLSRTDALTGLSNRGHFQEQLDALVAAALAGSGAQVALLIADLDHFKSVNDRHGHVAGDLVLREVASLLRESFIAPGTVVARLGGEEFGVLAAPANPEEFALLAETFRARLARKRIELAGGTRLEITASLGLARFSAAEHAGGDALYAAADAALYRAKAAGRNRLEAA
jgi:diguanylate cyclase (GGDEF)-like protein